MSHRTKHNMLPVSLCSILGISLIAITPSDAAQAEESLTKALTEGTPYIDLRYRYEYASQDAFTQDAHASTLRSRVGYKSGKFYDFSGVVEFENITNIGNDNYNSTTNGNTTRPVVADPESTELNQAYVQYDGVSNTSIRAGRQVFNLDNQRFIGSVGWRQNNQTLDALTLSNSSLENTKVTYGYVNNVNRIFGNDSARSDFDSDSHIINITNKSLPIGAITAYGYVLDFQNDAAALSSKTFGASLVGSQPITDKVAFKYRAEYARQSDHGNNATNFSADYIHLAPALSYAGLTATAGYEKLGSDNGGTVAFTTPLATAHKFNGFADIFLATPAAGLEDLYVDLTYKFSGLQEYSFFNGLLIKGAYHDFSSDVGNIDYGTEFDMYVKQPIEDHYYVEAKYADYDADNFATDTQRFILGVGVKY